MTDYKDIASFYDLWSLGDPIANSCKKFYIELCLQENGKVVELGVGTGRIAIEIAQKGKFITGVDSCKEMLSVFQQKAKDKSVLHNIEVINNDVLNFNLHNKADLITFPFRSIGHVLGLKEKGKMFENIFNQLNTNGLFVFDHYVFDKTWAEAHNGITRLMYQSIKKGEGVFIWDTYLYDYKHQLMECFVTYEETTNQNIVKFKKIVPFKFSWVYPKQIRELAETAGFKIVDIYGDFNKSSFNNKSSNQIWFLQKNRMVLHELKSYHGKYFDTMSSAINIVLKDYNINLHPYLDSFLLRTFAFQFDKNNPKLWFSPFINQLDSVKIFKELFASHLDIQINTIDYNSKETVINEIDKMLRLGSVIVGNLDKSKIWNRIESLHYKGAAYYVVINDSNKNNYTINDPSGCPFMFLSKDKILSSFCNDNKTIQLIQIKPINPVFEVTQSFFRNTLNRGISYRNNIKENDLLLSNGMKSLLNNDFVFKSSHEAILNFAIPNYSIFLYHLNLFINEISDNDSFRKFYIEYVKFLAELLFQIQNINNFKKTLVKIVDYEYQLDNELNKLL